LQKKNNRLKKKVSTLKGIVSDLRSKNFINPEIADILDSIPGPNAQLLRRIYMKKTGRKVSMKYPPEIRDFALNLHFFSPSAYAYVRKTYDSVLPHVETIAKWYRSVKGDPGITEEAFHMLDVKVRNSGGKTIFCNLTIDEMSIRKREIWDETNKKYLGRVCMPGEEKTTTDSAVLASNAFVLMIVSVNENWKLPIGYFLCNSLSSEQKVSILHMALTRLQNVGVCVTGLTFDGLASNTCMASMLGCDFASDDVLNINPVFYINDQPILCSLTQCI
jgi:DNA transposase THAP9